MASLSLSPSPRRLHSNHLYCDCHLAWLSDWLRQRRTIGQFTLCMAPVHLRGFNVADVQKKEYVCPGKPAVHLPISPCLPGLGPDRSCPRPYGKESCSQLRYAVRNKRVCILQEVQRKKRLLISGAEDLEEHTDHSL